MPIGCRRNHAKDIIIVQAFNTGGYDTAPLRDMVSTYCTPRQEMRHADAHHAVRSAALRLPMNVSKRVSVALAIKVRVCRSAVEASTFLG
jgi:hypothetical protein